MIGSADGSNTNATCLCVALLIAAALAPAPAHADLPPSVCAPSALAWSESDVVRMRDAIAARMPDEDDAAHGQLARTILAEATITGVDPLLVLALIHVESGFDPQAISPAGALGLMQLREGTLRAEAARARLPAGDPRDPVGNVRAGIRYLSRLLSQFPGLDLALMAYNAGPNRILGHMRAGGIPDRFRDYPRRVKQELARVRAELGLALAPPARAPRNPVVAMADATPPSRL
jgi:soluble lytic murein transglycosylase-like protein